MNLISNKNYSIELALKMGFYILLDVKSEGCFKLEHYGEKSLKELEETIIGIEDDFIDSFLECNETFLDVSENYRKQGIYKTFLTERIRSAEAYEGEFDEVALIQTYEKFLDELDTYVPLLRKCVVSNIFSDLLLPESDINNMIIAFQWLGMEYAVIRQVLFLDYQRNGSLNYEKVREVIVYISRMTGYDEEDIVEYLSNCFEELEWEWGYFAFLV